MKEFSQPTGVVDVQLDKATNRLATPTCPDDYTSAFIAGTEPHETCDQQNGAAGFFSRLFGGGDKSAAATVQPANGQDNQDPKNQDPKKKKGFFGKIAGIFKDDKQAAPVSKPPDSGQATSH
jgi:penicillin-binding protein 1B